MKQQKNGDLLSMEEAAKRLGLSKHTLRIYARTERLKAARNDGNGLFFAREAVEEYRKKRQPYPFKTKIGERETRREIVAQPGKIASTTPPQDDAAMLQSVLSTALSFLATHHLPVAIESLREVKALALRLWTVETPACTLRIVANGAEISVLSDVYQRELETKVQSLQGELREAQTKLKYLRDKPRALTLEEYAQPLSVFIEARENGFFVWSEEYPFAAYEHTEDDALAAFRRVLWGYRAWLQFHERSLTAKMQEDYIKLDDLLVER